jgi:hypothetical protein
VEEEDGKRLEAVQYDGLAVWDIDLSKPQSSWNPGRCLPLVFTFWVGWAETVLQSAFRWWVARDAHPAD